MMKTCFVILLLLFSILSSAQGESNIWYFGRNAGLNFNNNPPTPLFDLPVGDTFSTEGCSTISDNNGNLLFYTNGEKVWNRNHLLMINGNNLAGHNSSTQASAIIPYPGTYDSTENRFDKYFLVTLDQYSLGTNGVRFSEINMTSDNGFGEVTSNKNIHLFGTTTTEKVCVVPHSNGCDFWVICKVVDSPEFYSYLITSNGFNTTPIISTTSIFVDASPGQMKTSPNDKLLSYVVPSFSAYSGFYVFNFDNATGLITEKYADTLGNENQYGTAFSPDSKILYKCAGNQIHQYNLEAITNADFIASKLTFNSSTSGLQSMQLAPDNRIYIARPLFSSTSNNLGVINNPNVMGQGFDYLPNQQNLGGRLSLAGLPNQLNSLIPHNNIFVENENCNSVQIALENNNNIISYSWTIANSTTPSNILSTSTAISPIFNFPDFNENYIITCSVVSECYNNTYQLLFTPSNPNYINPTFNLSTNIYCENQTPNPLPSNSIEGVTGDWLPDTIDTSVAGTFMYVFSPLNDQCANDVSVSITINPNVFVNFSETIICEEENINFPDTNNINGTWFPAILSNINSNTYTFMPNDICAVSTQWNLVVNKKISVVFDETNICEGDTINFPSTNNLSGSWSPNTINNTQNAIYTFTPNGNCVQPTTWQVNIVKKLVNLNVSIFNTTTIIANVENTNNQLLYQLDNSVFQHSNIFKNVSNGCHTINVTDLVGCTSLSSTVFVFDYPKFFTPNDDGNNDFWNIRINNSKTNIFIFDRYGKFLKQIRQNDIGWNGTYNGYKLPATDYWFLLEYEDCGVLKTYKSHFSLLR